MKEFYNVVVKTNKTYNTPQEAERMLGANYNEKNLRRPTGEDKTYILYQMPHKFEIYRVKIDIDEFYSQRELYDDGIIKAEYTDLEQTRIETNKILFMFPIDDYCFYDERGYIYNNDYFMMRKTEEGIIEPIE